MIPRLSQYTYQPIRRDVPIEDYQNAFAMSAKAYDTNLENYNVLNAYASTIKALPQDNEYVQQALKGVDEAVSSIAEQVSGNQRWDLAGSALQSMKSKLTADPKLHAIRESYLNFQKGEEEKAKMLNDGQTPFELTDFNQHKSINPDGTVNIYRPQIQPKADYVKKAQDLMGQIAPDIVSKNLQPSEIAGILEGKTIKGISREKILSVLDEAEALYNQTSEGIQHRQFLTKTDPNINQDKFIRNFLFGVGNLRTFREERIDNVTDPSFAIERDAAKIQAQLEAKMKFKQATGRGNYDEETEGFFRIEPLYRRGKVGEKDKVGSAIMFSNQNIGKGVSATQIIRGKEDIHLLDKQNEITEDDVIDEFDVKGINMDTVEGSETLGGLIGELKVYDKDDPKESRKLNVIIKSHDPETVNALQSYDNIVKALRAQSQGSSAYNNKLLPDTSGLLDFTNRDIVFRLGDKGQLIPMGKNTEGKYDYFKKEDRDYLGIKPYYSIKDIQNLTIDKVAPRFKKYSVPASKID